MQTLVSSSADLVLVLETMTEEIVNEVAGEVLSLLKVFIIDNVYENHRINTFYARGSGTPTYEFLYAWDWDALKKTTKKYTRTLFYDPTKLSVDAGTAKRPLWIHYSHVKKGKRGTYGDSRKYLMDILNMAHTGYKAGRTSDLKFGTDYFSPEREPYWEKFIEELDKNKSMEKFFDAACLRRGFVKT